MTRFARIDTATLQIVEFKLFDEKPEDIPHKNIAWLPAPEIPAPQFDPARQVLEGPFHDIVSLDDRFVEVAQSWKVRDKTREELDADLDAKIARVDEVTRAALADIDARVTTLEGKQSRGIFSFFRSLFGG